MSDSSLDQMEHYHVLPRQRRRMVIGGNRVRIPFTKKASIPQRFVVWGLFIFLGLLSLAVHPLLTLIFFILAGVMGANTYRGFVYERILLALRGWQIRRFQGGVLAHDAVMSSPQSEPKPFPIDDGQVTIHGYGGGSVSFVSCDDEPYDIFVINMVSRHSAPFMDQESRAIWNNHFVEMLQALSELGAKRTALVTMQLPGNGEALDSYISKRVPPTPQGSYLEGLVRDYVEDQEEIVQRSRSVVELLVLQVPRDIAWGRAGHAVDMDTREYSATPIKAMFNTVKEYGLTLKYDVVPTPPLGLNVLMKLGLDPARASNLYDLYEDALDGADEMGSSLMQTSPWRQIHVSVDRHHAQIGNTYHRTFRVKSYPKHRRISPEFFDMMLVFRDESAWFTQTQAIQMVPSDRYERASWYKLRLRNSGNRKKTLHKTEEIDAEAHAQEDYDTISRAGGELAAFAQLIRVSAASPEDLDDAYQRLKTFLRKRGVIIEELDGEAQQIETTLATLGINLLDL